jgi:uncharacterized membrane protein YbhN (UPF0104 family)
MKAAARRRLGIALRVLFAVVGLVFVVVAFRNNWDRSRQHVLPSGWAFVGAFILLLAGVALSARAWVALLSDRAPGAALASGFYTSQLGKYVPGAVWQAASQVGLARRAGVTTAQAVTAFPVSAITQATAGGTVGAGLLIVGWRIPLSLRLASLAGLVLVPLQQSTWKVNAVHLHAGLLKRTWPEDLVPSQGRILRAYGYAMATLILSGAGFMLLASSVHAVRSTAACVPAFALAWTAGFLALPFPSGVGVREAVLIAVLSPAGRAAPVIGSSVAHRLVTIVAELAMILWAAIHRAPRPPLGSESSEAGST